MGLRRILLQLDSDPHPSVFDRVVAIDAGVDEVFSEGNVQAADVESLIHGLLFTRKPSDLKNSAVFIGGKEVSKAEELLANVKGTYFGPFRCSVLMDANGSNTTAAAAVLAVKKSIDLNGALSLVLGGSGPVGQRVALLLARLGATVHLASRSMDRAKGAVDAIRARVSDADARPVCPADHRWEETPYGVIVSAGAAGVTLLSAGQLAKCKSLKVAIDLNAVPPAGIEGIEPADNGKAVDGRVQFGALGVGGLKMKIHRAALAALFERNDLVLDAEQVFDLAETGGLN